MKTETANYADAAGQPQLSPRFVIALSFDDANTDVTYLTSHADAFDPGGVAAIDRIDDAIDLRGISGQTQKISPDTAQHTIGSMTYRLLDVGGALTAKLNTKLSGGEGLRKKRLVLYKGHESLTSWSDYTERLTYLVDSVSYKDGAYTVGASDIQRQEKTDIFNPDQGVLTSTIEADAAVIPITVAGAASKFQLLEHDADYTSNPSLEVGYIKIDDEIICHSGWTDGTFSALVVVERGALNTLATRHNVTAVQVSQRKKVDEYIYIEMPVPKMIYAILTGNLEGQPGKVMPDGWHLAIDTAYVRLSDFTGVGADLWDPATNTGRVARFFGLEETDGKEFIEEELLLWLGVFMPVYSDGAIGLKRLQGVVPGSSYDALIDEDEILSYGELRHDLSTLINNIAIHWNYIDTLDRFTKVNQLVDATSIAEHEQSELKKYEFKGVFTGVHSDSDIVSYFTSIRDRYSNPPLRLRVTVMPQWDRLDVGDTVRVKCGHIVDFNTGVSIDRTFEIQQIRTDWITGKVTLDLFGGIKQSIETPLSSTDVMLDSYYTSSGTELSTQVPITAGSMTANGTINGGASILNNEFFHDGDLTVNAGVLLTSNRNALLKVKGFLVVNGDINVVGDNQESGWLGASNSGKAGEIITSLSGQDQTEANIGDLFRRQNDNLLTAPQSNLSVRRIVNTAGTSLSGIPDDLSGQRGSTGSTARVLERTPGASIISDALGGAGGAGGGGLVIVCRGMTINGSGSINTSGQAGSAGGSASSAGGKTVRGQTGSGGFPGGVLVLIDGNYSAPVITVANFTALRGDQDPPAGIDEFAPGSGAAFVDNTETGYGQNIVDNFNYYQSVVRVQYIPEPSVLFDWLPKDELGEVPATEVVQLIKSGAVVDSTSGTSALFGGIPSGTKQIIVGFSGVSTTGNQDIVVRLGDSSGVKVNGYVGRAGWLSSGGSSVINITNGFGIHGGGSFSILNGNITITLIDPGSNIWSASGGLSFSYLMFTAGSVTLPGELTQVEVLTQLGDSFDAGKINIVYI